MKTTEAPRAAVRAEDEIAPEIAGPLPLGLDDRIQEIGSFADKVEGFLDPAAGALLYRLARLHAPEGAVVELGSWKGRSTVWLASAVHDRGEKDARVFSVDTWAGSPGERLHGELLNGYKPDQLFEEFKSNLRRANLLRHVATMRADTAEASRKWPMEKPIGLLFIDASHDYRSVRRDFEHWSPFVADGGYVVFDDVPGWPGPSRLITELPRWYSFVGAGDGVWVVQRRSN